LEIKIKNKPNNKEKKERKKKRKEYVLFFSNRNLNSYKSGSKKIWNKKVYMKN
jgi:hypothetical protein